MADVEWFPATTVQGVIRNTGGKLVEYRGQQAYFHFENPTQDDLGGFQNFQGYAKLLIGDARVFPDLEENTLITVEGDDWLVGEWITPGDGDTIFIALKTTART